MTSTLSRLKLLTCSRLEPNREGHEFHSCHNQPKIGGGFQPLGQCRRAAQFEEDGMKPPCAVNLHNAVTVSQQRLGRRVAHLSAARINKVGAAPRFSLECDSN